MVETAPDIRVLASPASFSQEIKKSRFTAIALPLESVEPIDQLIASHHDPDARHHCWAWRCAGQYRFHDAGEPGGTAGKPILMAIEHADLDHTLVIVQRIFGGIKLGAGGLARAYGGTAAQCLNGARTRLLREHTELAVTLGFDDTQALFALLPGHGAELLQQDYTDTGLEARIELATQQLAAFSHALADRTHGRARLRVTGKKMGSGRGMGSGLKR